MTVATNPTEVTKPVRRHPGGVIALSVLLVLLAIGSLQGGIAMMLDPITPLGMSIDFLEKTPIDDYFLPGLFLIGIAAASLLAVVGMLFEWRWQWADRVERRIGYRWPWVATMAVGVLLLVFEIVELFVVPFHPIMHPLLIAASVAILALAWMVRDHFSAE